MKRKHDEASVIRSLMRKRGEIKVDAITKTIEVVKSASSVGIRTWGKIDYLVHYCGYHQIFVINVSRVSAFTEAANAAIAYKNVNTKKQKQEAKLDIARSTKKILRSAKV